MTFDEPFRGSIAVRAGDVSWDRLAGPAFRRLAPDVHVSSGRSVTLGLFLRGLQVWRADTVVTGLSAGAVLSDVDDALRWQPEQGAFGWPGVGLIRPVEVVVGSAARSPAGTTVRQDALDADELAERRGIRVTSPVRTVSDLLRRMSRDVAVVAAESVASRHRVRHADVAAELDRRPRARGLVAAREALGVIEPHCRTPWVSQVRLALWDHGIGVPAVGEAVTEGGLAVACPDLAWPARRCAVFCGEREVGTSNAASAVALRNLGWSACEVSDAEADANRAGVVVMIHHMLRAAARRDRAAGRG